MTRRDGEIYRMGPMLTPAGEATVEATGDTLTVSAENGVTLTHQHMTGRLNQLHLTIDRMLGLRPGRW